MHRKSSDCFRLLHLAVFKHKNVSYVNAPSETEGQVILKCR